MENNLGKWFDKNFGDGNGEFSIKDFFKDAPAIAMIVGDLVMFVAEFRVFQTGMYLTNNNWFLSLGFVLVSSLPFYVGQILFMYNYANTLQMLISIAFIVSGLLVSGYYGLRDFMLSAGLPVDANSAFWLAIVMTVSIIGSLILFATIDDKVRQKRRLNRLKAEANIKKREMDIQRELLAEYNDLAEEENRLSERYGRDVVEKFGSAKLGLQNTYAADVDGLPNSKSQ